MLRSKTPNAIKNYFKLSNMCAKVRLITRIIVMWGGEELFWYTPFSLLCWLSMVIQFWSKVSSYCTIIIKTNIYLVVNTTYCFILSFNWKVIIQKSQTRWTIRVYHEKHNLIVELRRRVESGFVCGKPIRQGGESVRGGCVWRVESLDPVSDLEKTIYTLPDVIIVASGYKCRGADSAQILFHLRYVYYAEVKDTIVLFMNIFPHSFGINHWLFTRSYTEKPNSFLISRTNPVSVFYNS